MINLAIYSIEGVDSFRYNFFLFSNLFKSKCSETLNLYVEDDIDIKTLDLFKKHFKFVFVTKVFLLNSNRIHNILKRDGIDFLVINSFTAADFRMLNAINNLNIFTLYIQHGLYLRYMKRNLAFFIYNFKRAFSSLYYVLDICSFNLVKSYQFSMVYLRGESRNVISHNLRSKTNLNIVLSKYWQEFHENIYLVNSEYFIAGFLDYLKFGLITIDGIVYCSQTLVEDGRIDKSTMLNFYNELYDFGNRTSNKIFIKTHPRNSKWTIDIFKKFNFVIIEKEIPIGKVAVGHYSSLLPIWVINKCPVIIFELKNHSTPESISKVSSLTIQTFKNIDIQALNHLELNKRAVEYFGDIPNQKNIIFNILKQFKKTIFFNSLK